MAHEEALSSQHSVVSEKQNQYQNQNLFTTEDTEATEEDKTSPTDPGHAG
jgi:hypothetical protein